jgi:hypothetical protein
VTNSLLRDGYRQPYGTVAALAFIGLLGACVRGTDNCATTNDCDPGNVCMGGRCTAAPVPAVDAAGEGARAVDVSFMSPNADAGGDVTVVASRDSEACDNPSCGWRPSMLPGVVLWLDASLGVTISDGLVMAWRDQSGLGNDATQTIRLLAPTLAPSDANGRPMVVFGAPGGRQGVHMVIRDHVSLRWAHRPFAVFLVGAATNRRLEPGVLFRKRGADPGAPGLQMLTGGGDDGLRVVLRSDLAPYNTITSRLSVGPLFAFGVRRTSSTTLELRVNGRGDGRANSSEVDVDVSAEGADAVLGAGSDESPPCCQLFGGIAEVVAIDGNVAEEDLGQLEGYLRAKYALP